MILARLDLDRMMEEYRQMQMKRLVQLSIAEPFNLVLFGDRERINKILEGL